MDAKDHRRESGGGGGRGAGWVGVGAGGGVGGGYIQDTETSYHLSKDPDLFETVKVATTPVPCDPETKISPEI